MTNSKNSSRASLIQFRADANFVRRLEAVATRLHTPPGVLARQWVAAKLAEEFAATKEQLETWRSQRFRYVHSAIQSELEAGPVQVLFIQPLSIDTTLQADQIATLHPALPPIERSDEYVGRINALGYRTQKIFRDMLGKTGRVINGYVQVFTSGEVESVRVLHDVEQAVFGDQVEEDLIRATWSYLGVLRTLGVEPLLEVTVIFHFMNGLTVRSRKKSVKGAVIDFADLRLPAVEISNWESVETIEACAEVLRSSLDKFWNAAGYPRSPNYSPRGVWLIPKNSEFHGG